MNKSDLLPSLIDVVLKLLHRIGIEIDFIYDTLKREEGEVLVEFPIDYKYHILSIYHIYMV